MNLTDIALAEPVQTKVAWFLTDIGEYDAATSLLKEVIDQATVQHGRTSELLLNALHCIVYLLYRKGMLSDDNACTHKPLYKTLHYKQVMDTTQF